MNQPGSSSALRGDGWGAGRCWLKIAPLAGWHQMTLLAGSSAGALCWGPWFPLCRHLPTAAWRPQNGGWLQKRGGPSGRVLPAAILMMKTRTTWRAEQRPGRMKPPNPKLPTSERLLCETEIRIHMIKPLFCFVLFFCYRQPNLILTSTTNEQEASGTRTFTIVKKGSAAEFFLSNRPSLLWIFCTTYFTYL